MLDGLPQTQREAVRAAVAATFGRPIETLEPVGGGLSGALVNRLVVDGRAYLLRIVLGRDELRDPRRHFACLKIAAEAGLAPAIHHLDAAAGIAITDFITATPFAAMFRPRPELLIDLARAVRRLQDTPAFPPLVHCMDRVTALIEGARASQLLPPAAEEVFQRHAEMAAAYPREPSDLVSSHNDINPGNIIWDGQRLWLVDWEMAHLNDRYVDPATVCNWFTATPQAEELFLNAYFGTQPNPSQRARLHLVRQACHLAFALVMIRLGVEAGPGLTVATLDGPPLATIRAQIVQLIGTPEGKVQLGLASLNEVLRNSRDPYFPEALRAAAESAP
jgi:aminoglycoside phosphotransferase (APT) family kinase protein